MMTTEEWNDKPAGDGVAGIILHAWDSINRPLLPIDWLFWRVAAGHVAQQHFLPTDPDQKGFPKPIAIPTVEFRRITCRPFDHGRMWSVVFGRFEGREIMVEAVQI